MNVERLQAVADQLRKEPTRFNLETWFGGRPYDDRLDDYQTAEEAWCGTTACIAGTALAMFAPDDPLPPLPYQQRGRSDDLHQG
jgi:hypothetical protein